MLDANELPRIAGVLAGLAVMFAAPGGAVIWIGHRFGLKLGAVAFIVAALLASAAFNWIGAAAYAQTDRCADSPSCPRAADA
jgi:hypothetical protein